MSSGEDTCAGIGCDTHQKAKPVDAADHLAVREKAQSADHSLCDDRPSLF